jgi:hypothetical protein
MQSRLHAVKNEFTREQSQMAILQSLATPKPRHSEKAAEGRRSPRRWRVFPAMTELREAFWSAPALWRFKSFWQAMCSSLFTPPG